MKAAIVGLVVVCLSGVHGDAAGPVGQMVSLKAGSAGKIELGEVIGERGNLMAMEAPGAFMTADGLFAIQTDERGRVVTITIEKPEVFTERLIRPKVSTAADVLQVYGRPPAIEILEHGVVFKYKGYSIEFKQETGDHYAKESYLQLMKIPIERITLGEYRKMDVSRGDGD